MATSCRLRDFDVCNPESPIVELLETKYPEWSYLVESLPPSTNGVETLHVGGGTYSVRVLKYTDNEQPILSVSTNEGYPRMWVGISGYFYTPTTELLNLSDTYEIEAMKDNVYCYRRKSVEE